MSINKMKKFKSKLDALLAALVLTGLLMTGQIKEFDASCADKLYTQPTAPSDNIVIFGIDKLTIDRLGKLSSWVRREMPNAIEYLNNHDSTARPAVIGIDLFFQGENKSNPDDDQRFTEICNRYKNVVLGDYIDVPESEKNKNEENPLAIFEKTWSWSGAFPKLAEVTTPGHVVIQEDKDGIVRHVFEYVRTEEFGNVPSFANVLYKNWCIKNNHKFESSPHTDDNGMYYLPFSSNEYATYSFIDLLDGKIDSNIYKDKIVLIGITEPGSKDVFRVPVLSTGTMYGVMVHANIIDAYNRGFFPKELSDNLQLVLFFIICAVTEYFFRKLKIQFVVVLWLALSAGSIFICQLCYKFGFILHPTWIPMAITILMAGSLLGNYLRIKTEQIRLSSMFERYFDSSVMKELLEEDSDELKLGGREREIAVLFVDIRGFTTMSEQLPSSYVVDILNDYLKLTTECVRRHHGTLDKFIGDCTMAFWNAPREQENAVLLATRAAVDMISGLEDLRKNIMTRHDKDISFGIGIHWGKATVGNIGSELRMDYTAIGDTVNTAARLEANAGRGEIYISKEVADILGKAAVCQELPTSIKLKGKTNHIEVLKLIELEGRKIDGKGEV